MKISSISKDDFYAANVVNKLNTIENEVTRRKLAASLLFAVVEQQALDEVRRDHVHAFFCYLTKSYELIRGHSHTTHGTAYFR